MKTKNGRLTDLHIKNVKFEDKGYNWRLADEKGLYVLVTKTGKYFRFDYRFGKRRNTLAIGVHPDVSLKEARVMRDDARQLIRKGIDPAEKKKVEKARRHLNQSPEVGLEVKLPGGLKNIRLKSFAD